MQDASVRGGRDERVAAAHDERRGGRLEHVPVARREDRVVGAAALRLAQGRHVDGVRQGLRAQQQPGSARGRRERIPAVERDDADAFGARPREIGCLGGRHPRGRRRSVLDSAAENQLDDRLAGTAVRGGPVDGGPPLREVRQGQFAQLRRMGESLEVRGDLLRVPVDDPDRLEDAVAALRAELTHGERGRRRVDLGEGVVVVGAVVAGRCGVDHESEAPSHAPSLRRAPAPGMPGRAARLHWISRAAVTPGSIFRRFERPRAERRSAARHFCARPAHSPAPPAPRAVR